MLWNFVGNFGKPTTLPVAGETCSQSKALDNKTIDLEGSKNLAAWTVLPWGAIVNIDGKDYECLGYGYDAPKHRLLVVIPKGTAVFSSDDEAYEFSFAPDVEPIWIVIDGDFASDGKWQTAKVG